MTLSDVHAKDRAMAKDVLPCPNPLASRLFAYGEAAALEGNAHEAAELFVQVVERAPHWAPAWFALAQARQACGDKLGAVQAYREALRYDVRDILGSGPRLALLEGSAPVALPPAYVTRLFDDYAPHFDRHLRDMLHYRGPEGIVEALQVAGFAQRRFARCVDLGCGSGLMGALLRDRVEEWIGVDLSSAMIAKARQTGSYDDLIVGDCVAYLQSQPAHTLDLIVAADALVYIGDLAPLFAAVAQSLRGEGVFVFTLEQGEALFALSDTLRFRHAESYIHTCSSAVGLEIVYFAPVVTRTEAKADVQGRVVIARKP